MINSQDMQTLSIAVQDYERQANNYHFYNWEIAELDRCEKEINRLIEKYKNNNEALAEIRGMVSGIKRYPLTNLVEKIDNYTRENNNKMGAQSETKEQDDKKRRDYMGEMDILINDFNEELKNTLHGRSIDEIGITELEKINEDFITLDTLNKELIAEVNNDTNYDLFEKTQLLQKFDHLYDDNVVSFTEIGSALYTKKALLEEKNESKESLTARKESNLEVLESLKNTLEKTENEVIAESIRQSIEKAEELDRELDLDIENVDKEIDQLINGGKIEVLEKVKEEQKAMETTTRENISREELATRIQRLSEVADRAVEASQELSSEPTPEPAQVEPEQVTQTQGDPEPSVTDPEPEPVPVSPAPEAPQAPNEPAQAEPAQTAPEQTSEIVYATGSLADLRNKGRLPKNLSDEQLINLSNQLGLGASDMNFVPTKEQMSRLVNDKQIRLAFTNEKISAMHTAQLERHDKVYQGFGRLDTTGLDSSYSATVGEQAGRLEADMDELAANSSMIDANSVSEHFEMDPRVLDGLSKMRVENLDKRSDKVNEKLRKEYQKLDQQKQAVAHTKIKQAFNDRRIRKTQEKIARLQAKEARLSGKQFELMGEKAQKYIERRNRELARHQDAQRRAESRIAEVQGYKREQARVQQEIEAHELDIANTTGTKLGDRIERFQLERSKARLERQGNRLERRVAMCDLREQVFVSLNEIRGLVDDGGMRLAA